MIGKDKVRVKVTIEKKKLKLLREKAKNMGMSLSNLMSKSASDVDPYFTFTNKVEN